MVFRRSQLAEPVSPDLTAWLDMLPIPAAVIAPDGDRLALRAANQGFRSAALEGESDGTALIDLLVTPIRAFLDDGEAQRRFPCSVGDAVNSRHFAVQLARMPDDRSGPSCMATLIDETPGHRTEHSLRREMNIDALTGLPNRAGFGDLLEERIATAGRDRFAVLAVNLDRFSRVNACMGALTGDELLISVARRLKGALRGRDLLARTGGDEFAILLTLDKGSDDASFAARRIEAALSTPFRLSDFEISVHCSIGIALGGDAAGDAEDLIRHAQFASKQSKQSGAIERYQAHAFHIVRSQFAIETELRHAIDAGELRLQYQPIWHLAGGQVIAFEALARWPRGEGRTIPPDQFIPVAEESGLIVPLGRWAIDEAARTLSAWDIAAGGQSGVRMAVNLSAVQLQRDEIAPLLESALMRHRVAASRFTLELTESAIVTDPERSAATMHALKELGATLAMDDFGTGYSNLASLQKLPIDILKIDRSFVAGMHADRDKAAIVRAILSLAEALNMRTTAEGIETPEVEAALAALGCSHGQGYWVSPPVDADAAYRLLVSRNH